MNNKPKQSATSKNKANARPAATNSASSRREQLRLQQEAEAKREQQRRIAIIAMVVVFALLMAILAGYLIQTAAKQREEKRKEEGIGVQIVPADANDAKNAIVIAKGKADSRKPLVTAFEDPQCPGCATMALTVDPMLESLAEKGEIRLQYQILIGLDRAYPGQHSYRGALGMTCAADVGRFAEYNRALYAAHPRVEGDGWTDAQVTEEYTKAAGITGADLDKFKTCYTERQTHDFVNKMNNERPSYIDATPSFALNGKKLEFTQNDIKDEQSLLEAIKRNS